MSVLLFPRGSVGDEGLAQGGNDRHLSSALGLGGGGPIGQAAVHVGPSQSKSFADPGSSPTLDSPVSGLSMRRGRGQKGIELFISEGGGLAVAVDFHGEGAKMPR